MVNEEIVNSTIKRMLDAEIDNSTIISTLKDIGMSEELARAQIEKVKNSSNDSENVPDVNTVEEDVKEDSSDFDDGKDNKELGDVTEQNIQVMQDRKIDEVNNKIEDFKKSVGDLKKSDSFNELNEKISSLSAQNNAIMKIMKDILEANRKILSELESKK
ncbi:MAG: hypothetical protein PHP82_03875 [Candidatus ainarchaeum sp.]|nr:hypothetical protein [Candidatus ainarchaeum sp.]